MGSPKCQEIHQIAATKGFHAGSPVFPCEKLRGCLSGEFDAFHGQAFCACLYRYPDLLLRFERIYSAA